VAPLGGACARVLIPRASALVGPGEHVEVPGLGRLRGSPLVPRAPVEASPLQNLAGRRHVATCQQERKRLFPITTMILKMRR
jgi:hypothetical protein